MLLAKGSKIVTDYLRKTQKEIELVFKTYASEQNIIYTIEHITASQHIIKISLTIMIQNDKFKTILTVLDGHKPITRVFISSLEYLEDNLSEMLFSCYSQLGYNTQEIKF